MSRVGDKIHQWKMSKDGLQWASSQMLNLFQEIMRG